MRLYTIGHSSRDTGELIALLEAHGVRRVADVRAFPASKRHPHFARDALAAALADKGVAYDWLGEELGGYRKRTRDRSPHTALDDFRAYADHMETDLFRRGVRRLLAPGTAFLCAEKDWRQCHRRFLADHLVALEGTEVVHIVEEGRTEPHRLDPRARVDGDRLVYDRGVQGELF